MAKNPAPAPSRGILSDRGLLAGIAGLFGNTPDSSASAPAIIEDAPMDDQFENRKSLHFCNKCGWCDELSTTMRKSIRLDNAGVPETVYSFLDTETPVDCPRCSKKSVYPMCHATTTKAVIYLLRAFQ